ncbi:hypothetical protein [Streptomyces sp. I8-5]|uniref:hypothetical protein n=1 Tax=Streptomyces sp. I8-5 TaxID=3104277 RepID=UPI003870DC0E
MGIFAKLRAALDQEHPPPYTFEVTENIATAGMGTTRGLKYRCLTSDGNGAPVKVDYAFTYKQAYAMGAARVAKLDKRASEAEAA